MTIAILDYGMGNLPSVARAVEHVGGKPEVTDDAATALGADGLVVPGVGHFGACVRNLRDRGLDLVVREVAASGRPVFCVCVGMQVLFEGSEEDPAPGLGLFAGISRRLPSDVKVPHMGWNGVRWTEPHPYVRDVPTGTRFYFVHSYAPDPSAGTTIGTATLRQMSLIRSRFEPSLRAASRSTRCRRRAPSASKRLAISTGSSS